MALWVWVASVLLIIFIPGIFLFPYLFSIASDPQQFAELAKSDPVAVMIQIAAIFPAHLLTLLLAWFVVTKARRFNIRDTLGVDKGGFRWWHYCLILGGFLAIAAIVNYLVPEQENELIRILKSSRFIVYVVAFVAVATAPLAEEVVYRGILYSAFQRSFGVKAAFFLVTLLFALVHVPQYWPSYSTIFLLTLLSVILTLIRVRSGNLLPCIILHTAFNALQSIFLILEPLYKDPDPAELPAIMNFLLK